MKTEALEAELKTLMEETQIDTIISRGPSNGITDADMRIISRENPETQDMCSDGDNDDTQSNGRGVTNGYAFDNWDSRLASCTIEVSEVWIARNMCVRLIYSYILITA